MRLGRWACAACLALALAIAPGALRLASDPRPPVERAGLASEAPLQSVDLVVADEVAITPPGELTGPVAEPVAPPPQFAPAAPAPLEGEVFALIIGINDYPGRRSDLRSAVADAETLDAALDGFGVPDGNRVVLRDGQARLADVVAAIQSLVTRGGAGSTLVLGYTGHVRKLDRDTEAMVLADGRTLSDVELAALLAPATTQRMWVLLATCYAGGFTELLAPGRVLTAAAGANDLAYESRSLNASYLMHYLVREAWLFGKAGPSVQEAFAYADAALLREHAQHRPLQVDESGVPMILGAGDPTSAAGQAPMPAPPPPDPGGSTVATPPTTAPPKEPDCFLGLLCG
jgi:hypothetical protein